MMPAAMFVGRLFYGYSGGADDCVCVLASKVKTF